MSTVAKGLMWTSVVIVGGGLTLYLENDYNKSKAADFCASIAPNDSHSTVIRLAEREGLTVKDDGELIIVGGHRQGCRIETDGAAILRTGPA